MLPMDKLSEMEIKAYELSVLDAEQRLSQWEMAEGAVIGVIKEQQKSLASIRKEIRECKAIILKYSNK